MKYGKKEIVIISYPSELPHLVAISFILSFLYSFLSSQSTCLSIYYNKNEHTFNAKKFASLIKWALTFCTFGFKTLSHHIFFSIVTCIFMHTVPVPWRLELKSLSNFKHPKILATIVTFQPYKMFLSELQTLVSITNQSITSIKGKHGLHKHNF